MSFQIQVVHRLDVSGETLVEVREGDDDTFPLAIRVEHPHERFGTARPAKVRWPGTSDDRVELAEVFARAVTVAVEIARRLEAGASLYDADDLMMRGVLRQAVLA